MSIKFYNDLDLRLNEVKNMTVEKLASHPTSTDARFYFNTTDHKFYAYNGTEWIDLNNNGWRPAVDTYTDLALMANLEDGLAVYVNDEDKLYIWDEPTTSWILPNISKNQIYDYSIPDVQTGDYGKILRVNKNENGIEYFDSGEIEKEPTGFIYPGDINIIYDSVNKKVILTGNVDCLWRGKIIDEIVTGWESPPHEENPTQSLFLSYNGISFTWSSLPWEFTDIQICFLMVVDGQIFGIKETHGLMPWQTHLALHNMLGTSKLSGGIITNIILNSINEQDKRPHISESKLLDEDLTTTLDMLNNNEYTIFHLEDINSIKLNVDQQDITNISINGLPNYNQFNGLSFIQTELPKDMYMSVWLLAIPTTYDTASKKYRYVWVQGQSISNSISEERNSEPSTLNLGGLENISTEFVFIAKIIINRTGNQSGNWIVSEFRNIVGNKNLGLSVPGRTLSEQLYSEFNKIATQSIPSAVPTLITWNTIKDSINLLDPNDTTKFIISPGINKIRVNASIFLENMRRDRLYYLEVLLNENTVSLFEQSMAAGVGDGDRVLYIMSNIISVVAGDIVQLKIYQNSGGARNILVDTLTKCQVEVLN